MPWWKSNPDPPPERPESLVQRQCRITWLHTGHPWEDGGDYCYCPGVWPH
jgi:hypothetical protein